MKFIFYVCAPPSLPLDSQNTLATLMNVNLFASLATLENAAFPLIRN